MNDRPNLDRLVTDWLWAGAPAHAPQRVLATALDRVAGVGQERAIGGRWFDSWAATTPRLRLALVLVVLAALLGALAGAGALLRQEPRVPATSGPNGWLAYSQHHPETNTDVRNGAMDLYLARTGSGRLMVAGSKGEGGAVLMRAVCPAFSPDGTKLAYAESTNPHEINNTDVWATRAVVVLTLDGAGQIDARSIRISVPGTGVDPCPGWSPDGASLVVLAGAPAQLATARVAQETAIVPIEGAGSLVDVATFAVSPSGNTIATAGSSGIWLIPIRGGTPRRLVDSDIDGNIAWSPDGTRIVAAIFDPNPTPVGGFDQSIHVFNLDATSETLGYGYGPVWSPDGKRIAFERVPGAGTADAADYLVVADPDGSAPHVIALASLPPVGAGVHYDMSSGSVWSPDGTRLVFASGEDLISVSATGDPAPQLLASSPIGIGGSGMSWQQVRH